MTYLLSIFDEHWRAQARLSLGSIAGGSLIASLDSINWAAVCAALGMAINLVGPLIGIYRQWRVTQIEIAERERKLRELPVESIDPDRTAAAEGAK